MIYDMHSPRHKGMNLPQSTYRLLLEEFLDSLKEPKRQILMYLESLLAKFAISHKEDNCR